jgi:hypothetical protein
VKPPDSVPDESEHEDEEKRPDGVDVKRHVLPT